MSQNKMLAMILAGGRGSRLYDLTANIAKPAVPFGGKYRIVDFPLSNCANSGIDVVGVLTQYESVDLGSYAANAGTWGLDVRGSGVYVLPPREKANADLNVYRGTADAITQNIDFIDRFAPEYVLVLSGDHIYKMDYDAMLEYHIANNADATIAVRPVPWKEAPRFGIMNTDENLNIVEFEEKPANPKSNLASMGIYIFTWKKLKELLLADSVDSNSKHDFGMNLIPAYLNGGSKLVAYKFEGYWKDVGTVDSLWEANMDLLDPNSGLDLSQDNWRIYTEDVSEIPQYIGPDAEVENAYITQGCRVEGKVHHSVLFTSSEVKKDATVIDTVLMPGAVVESGATVIRALIANDVVIGKGAVVGSADSDKIELIAKDVKGVE